MARDPPPPPPDVSDLDVESTDPSEVVEYDADTETYRVSFDSDADPVSMAVVSTVAVVTRTNPTALPALGAAIDPDALASIARRDRGPSSSDVHVSFAYADCTVAVHSYGIVAVRPPESGERVASGGRTVDGE